MSVYRCRGVVQVVCASLLLLPALALARTLPGSQARGCQSDDFLQIQKTCKMENDDLLLSVKHHDNGMVCKKLVELFYCVAGHVPLCFHNLSTIYKGYFHSPHNCALSPQQIMSLQNLTTNTAHQQGQQGEVDVEVDIIVPVSTPSVETSSSEEEGEDDGEKGGGGGGEGMRHEEHSGSNRPTGAASSKTSFFTIPLVVMSCLGTWKVTSHLLLS